MSQTLQTEVEVDGGAVPVWVAGPPPEQANSLPGLVVIPSIFGAHEDLQAQMRTVADVATTVIMDPFWREGGGAVPYADHATAMGRLAEFDRQAAFADVAAVAAWTAAQSNGRLAALGICFGGPFVLLGASSGIFTGGVTWHGSRMEGVLDRLGDVGPGPFRFHFGDADPITPPEAIDAVRSHFAAHADTNIVVHLGAAHGFSHEGAAWDEAAAAAGLADVRSTLLALA